MLKTIMVFHLRSRILFSDFGAGAWSGGIGAVATVKQGFAGSLRGKRGGGANPN